MLHIPRDLLSPVAYFCFQNMNDSTCTAIQLEKKCFFLALITCSIDFILKGFKRDKFVQRLKGSTDQNQSIISRFSLQSNMTHDGYSMCQLCQLCKFCEFCEFCEFCGFCEFCKFCELCEFCELVLLPEVAELAELTDLAALTELAEFVIFDTSIY